MNDISEKDLVSRLKSFRNERKELEIKLDEIKRAEAEAESNLLEHLEAINATATAKYDNVGYAVAMKPRCFATCVESEFDNLKNYLANEGRLDLVKEKVMPSTLSAYVSELIAAGKPIPACISYYLKTSIKVY